MASTSRPLVSPSRICTHTRSLVVSPALIHTLALFSPTHSNRDDGAVRTTHCWGGAHHPFALYYPSPLFLCSSLSRSLARSLARSSLALFRSSLALFRSSLALFRSSLAFSRAHTHTSGDDGTVRIWDAQRRMNEDVVLDDRFLEGTEVVIIIIM